MIDSLDKERMRESESEDSDSSSGWAHDSGSSSKRICAFYFGVIELITSFAVRDDLCSAAVILDTKYLCNQPTTPQQSHPSKHRQAALFSHTVECEEVL